MPTAAAIIDLDDFRRRRQDGRQEKMRPMAMRAMRRTPTQVVLPFWVMWVPIWPIG